MKYYKKTEIQTKKKKPYKYHTIDSFSEMKNILYKKEVQDLFNKLTKEEYEKDEKDESPTLPPKKAPWGLSTLLVLLLNIFEGVVWITYKIKLDSKTLYCCIDKQFNLKLRRYYNAKNDVDSSNWKPKVEKNMEKVTSIIIEKNKKFGQHHDMQYENNKKVDNEWENHEEEENKEESSNY